MAINPIFSSADNTPNNVHKYDRFLHPGIGTSLASVSISSSPSSSSACFCLKTRIGTEPQVWGSVPILVFKQKQAEEEDGDEEMETDAKEVPIALDIGRICERCLACYQPRRRWG
jgi:pre-rRNA-processing protein TSR1